MINVNRFRTLITTMFNSFPWLIASFWWTELPDGASTLQALSPTVSSGWYWQLQAHTQNTRHIHLVCVFSWRVTDLHALSMWRDRFIYLILKSRSHLTVLKTFKKLLSSKMHVSKQRLWTLHSTKWVSFSFVSTHRVENRTKVLATSLVNVSASWLHLV